MRPDLTLRTLREERRVKPLRLIYNILRASAWIAIISMIFVVVPVLFTGAIETMEEVECLKWNSYALSYTNYYSQDWQFKQCERYNINLTK